MTESQTAEAAETIIADVTRASAMAHPNDIDAAVRNARIRLRPKPEWDAIAAILAERGLRGTVSDARHTHNRATHEETVARKKEAGEYGQPPKVDPLTGEAAMHACNLFIGGSRLWDMLGSDLRVSAATEQATANGHASTARLCRRLSKRVGPDKKVSECYTMDGLQKVYEDELSKSEKPRCP